jgi:hypothetical protein
MAHIHATKANFTNLFSCQFSFVHVELLNAKRPAPGKPLTVFDLA